MTMTMQHMPHALITSVLVTLLAGCALTAPATAQSARSAEAQPLSIKIEGRHFIDASGQPVRPVGVNYSGFEFAVAQGWSANDPSGAQAGQSGGPRWSAINAWGANTVRLPLNEASWLGYECTGADGETRDPDPQDNYRQAVIEQVEQAIDAGLYVIVDLHWSAPGKTCPLLQTQMANADNSLDFWTSIAETFKHQPAVMFELFNEPFMNFGFSGNEWKMMMKGTGGRFSSYPAMTLDGEWKEIKKTWEVASYQAMLDTVRATGATNVVLIGSMQYAQDLSGWLKHRPTDPLEQIAAVWHPYPTFGADWGTDAYAQPNYAPKVFDDILRIQSAGFPVIATETGDRNTEGTEGAPMITTVTEWADQHDVGILGWGWNVWMEPDHVLIQDVHGTPTDGYGRVFRDWMQSR